jgi:glycosyltransferase involved in cell wall biosynthesis
MSAQVSIVILSHNERDNISVCVESVRWSNDIVVLDSGSTDDTVAVAAKLGCRVLQRSFDNWSSHQTWALRNIQFRNPWVLNIDCDEVVSPELALEIAVETKASSVYSGFRMRRKDYLRGRWLRHATIYPTWLTRLYKPEATSFTRLVNPITHVEGKIGALRGHIIHEPFSKGIAHWIERHNSYSSFEAIEYMRAAFPSLSELLSSDISERRDALKRLFSRLPSRPFLKFCYYYMVRRGFLDGAPGFDYCVLQAIYEYLISLKVQEQRYRGAVNGHKGRAVHESDLR